MPFNIYPDAATSALLGTPLNTPVPLANGAAMSAFAPLAGHVGPDTVAPNVTLDTTFIRISMSGTATGTPPQVDLRAVNPTEGTEGALVTINPALHTDHNHTANLLDGSVANPTFAAGAYFFAPHNNNVYLLKVIIFISGTTLKLRITNNTGEDRDNFVWVVASSDAETQQPWIHVFNPLLAINVTPAALDYDVLINQDPERTALNVSIANHGTGSLTVSGVTPALPANFSSAGLPVTVLPNATPASVAITYTAPGAIGEAPATVVSFDGDTHPPFGAGHNRDLSLSAKIRALEIALLLDDSGSMSWEPDGDPLPSGSTLSRYSALAQAANEFLDMLSVFGFDQNTGLSSGRFGVVRFPATDPTNPSSFDLVSPGPITGDMQTAQGAISNNLPFFAGTPMGDAINRALTPGADYFTTDTTGVNLNRRWIILMTDGAENSSVHNSLEFIAPAAPPGASLADKKIKVFSVGYGVRDKPEVNYELLKQIAAGSFQNGDQREVEASGLSTTQLAAAFLDAIKTGLVPVSSPSDPSGRLTTNAPEARHQVIITPYDTKVAFVLRWNTEDAKRMRLHLLTPTCELITPESAGEGFGSGEIGFRGASRYQIYRIGKDYLRNTCNQSKPRHGVWTLVVFSDQLGGYEGGEDSEDYDYDVIVESRLQLNVRLDRATYFAGDPIGVSAIVTLDGKPITQAAISLSVIAPNQSVNNFLAAVNITAAEFSQAQEEIFRLTNGDTNAAFIKAHAAQKKGISFGASTSKASIMMTDPNHRGAFSAAFSQTATPGAYVLYVTAVGTTEDGVTFRREKRVQVSVQVRPEPQFTLFDIAYRQIFEEGQTINIADVLVRPRDRFGNVFLDKSANDLTAVRLTVEGGEFTGPLVNNLDGNYSRSVRFAPGVTPAIGLDVLGEKIVTPLKLAPVDQLRYVDHVTAFKLGGEAEKGANKHTDPNAALGDIRLNKPDEFVSLGAFGSLAVEIKRHVIEAQGDDDITVFVRPDDTLRSYLVEALPVGKSSQKPSHGRKKTWVALGTSPGVTQSFSLSSAGIKKAAAIRITDQSGRTRDINFKPSGSPGVSILGVGVKKIGRGGHHKKPHDDKKYDDKKKGGDRDYSHPKPGGGKDRSGQPKGAKPGAKPSAKPSAKPGAKQEPPKDTKGGRKK